MILYGEDRINTPNGADDEYVRVNIFTMEGVNLASIFLGGESKRRGADHIPESGEREEPIS
jgi:hypothetical protein